MTFQPGQSGNPAGRPKGSVNKQLAMLRDAVERVLPLVVDRALAGDAEAQKLILERGLPKLKPIDVPIQFTLSDECASTQSVEIVRQAAAGELPLSHAKEIVTVMLPIIENHEQLEATADNFMNAYLGRLLQSQMRYIPNRGGTCGAYAGGSRSELV